MADPNFIRRWRTQDAKEAPRRGAAFESTPDKLNYGNKFGIFQEGMQMGGPEVPFFSRIANEGYTIGNPSGITGEGFQMGATAADAAKAATATSTAKQAPWHQRGVLPRAAKAGYRGANAMSKALLGASIPQIGLAAGAIGGLGYLGMSMMGMDPGRTVGSAAGTVSGTMQAYKDAQRASRQQFQASAQGVTFGLQARRHG